MGGLKVERGVRRLGLAAGLALAAMLGGGCASTLKDAQAAYNLEEYDDAVDLYLETMETGKEDEQEVAREELYELHMELAEKYKKGRAKEAERHYRDALELRPNSSEAREGLARVLMLLYRHDEALQVVYEGAANGTCKPCGRLYAVMLIQRGDNRMANQDWAGAEADYAAALTVLPDPAIMVQVVRARMATGNNDGAVEMLRQTVDLIGAADTGMRQQFLELRRAAVLKALEEEKTELADSLLDLAPEGVGGEEQLGLAIEVALEFRRLGKPEAALSRMEALVALADAGKLQVGEARKAELRDHVAVLYAARGAMRLEEGDIGAATADIDAALAMRPDNQIALLQKVILLSYSGQAGEARERFGKVDKKAIGREEVDAILYAHAVEQALAKDDFDDAKRNLSKAKKRGPDVPEVHIASAMVLAQTEITNLGKSDLKELKKGSIVSYPGGTPVKAGEALSELDWARQQIRGQGKIYPFRAPANADRMKGLETKVREFYPLEVSFQSNPGAVLVLSSASGEVEVEVSGPGLKTTETVGKESIEVATTKAGLVTMSYRGTTRAFLAEPYTKVKLSL